MKWDADPNKELKFQILDMLIIGLDNDDAVRISLKMLTEAIDELFEKLLGKEE